MSRFIFIFFLLILTFNLYANETPVREKAKEPVSFEQIKNTIIGGAVAHFVGVGISITGTGIIIAAAVTMDMPTAIVGVVISSLGVIQDLVGLSVSYYGNYKLTALDKLRFKQKVMFGVFLSGWIFFSTSLLLAIPYAGSNLSVYLIQQIPRAVLYLTSSILRIVSIFMILTNLKRFQSEKKVHFDFGPVIGPENAGLCFSLRF